MDYSKKNLKRLYENYDGFEQSWYRADSKQEFLDYLISEGIMVDAVLEKINNNDIDIFDVLSNMAYDEEALTKEDRIEKVKESKEFEEYNESQKNVINELLDIYQNKGVTELENIKLLNIKNFNKFGGLVQIVNLFGGKENYRNMIFKVKDLLYS